MNFIRWDGTQFFTASGVHGSKAFNERAWSTGEMSCDVGTDRGWRKIKSIELYGGCLIVAVVPENPDATLIEAVQDYFGDEIANCRKGYGCFTEQFRSLVHALDKEIEKQGEIER